MPENKQPETKPSRRRGWLRRCIRGALWLLLLLVIFHRPIVHHGGRWAAIWLAKREGITLDLRIAGNVWNRIELHDVRATGTSTAPLEKLTLDRLAAEYSIPKLIRGDLTGIRAVEIGTLDTVITPQPPKKKEPKKPGTPLTQTLRKLLANPLPSPRLTVARVDVQVRDKAGATLVSGFSIRDGILAWERIAVPGIPPFEATSASLSLTPEKLSLEGLRLWPGVAVSSLQVRRASTGRPGGFDVAIEMAGGSAAISAAPDATTDEMHAKAELTSVAAERLAAHFGAEIPATVLVKSLAADFSIVPETPAKLHGDLKFTVDATAPKPGPGALLTGALRIADGVVEVNELSLAAAGILFDASGKLDIAGLLQHPARMPEDGAFTFEIESPDLGLAGKEFEIPLAGKLIGGGKLTVAGGSAILDAELNAGDVRAGGIEVAAAGLKLTTRKTLAEAAPFAGLSGSFTFSSGPLITPAVKIDRASLSASLSDLRAAIPELLIECGPNRITASASATLSPEGGLAAPPEAGFVIEMPQLDHFGVAPNGAKLRGAIRGGGSLTAGNSPRVADPAALRGSVKLSGTALALGDAHAGEFEIAVKIADGVAATERFELKFGEGNTAAIEARGSLVAPNEYSGRLALGFNDLAAFQPLLTALGAKQKLRGMVKLDWSGTGNLSKSTGTAALAMTGVRVGEFAINEARIAAAYSPDKIETTELTFVADKLRASGQLAWAASRLDLRGLAVKLDGQTVLTGELSAPLDPAAKNPVPHEQPLAASLVADKLDLGKLFTALGMKPPVTGTVTTKLAATGTLAKPDLTLDVQGRELRPAPPDDGEPLPLAATGFDLEATLRDDRFKLTGSIRQPELKPVTITADVPFALRPLLDGAPLDPSKIPLKASVQMPVSAINFITRLSPAVTTLDGSAAVLVRAGGTLAEPRLDGSVALKVNTLRLANPSVPPVNGFDAQIGLEGDTISITKFAGESGGGKFSLVGKINVAGFSQPSFDLAFKMKEMLLLRDDAILVRADSDITLRGPLNAATAAGNVFITQSRFAKDIDILPLSLPGKAKPVARSVSQPATVSFPDPPLRDWKFDIAIKSRADDPFRVRGNLARGEAALDLRFGGTGLEPYLTGAVSVEKFRATLPVSTLETRRGLVTFSRENPFVPQLDIEAETVIRRHTIIARVSGDATRPRLDLESEPPLEQGEILSLIATGSLTGEVGQNNTAMATRAAILVVKGWYKKLFKRDFPASSDDGGDSFMERFEIELGSLDQRTGQQEVTAQFRVTDNFLLLGDLEMGGGFTGRAKYLIRFK